MHPASLILQDYEHGPNYLDFQNVSSKIACSRGTGIRRGFRFPQTRGVEGGRGAISVGCGSGVCINAPQMPAQIAHWPEKVWSALQLVKQTPCCVPSRRLLP